MCAYVSVTTTPDGRRKRKMVGGKIAAQCAVCRVHLCMHRGATCWKAWHDGETSKSVKVAAERKAKQGAGEAGGADAGAETAPG